MNKIIQAASYKIEFGSLVDSSFQNLLQENYSKSKILILVDENTHDHCLDYLLTNFDELRDAEIMLLPAGEENKVMEVCFQVWEAMSEYKISRKDLIINLGGGVVTDMGGFIASIYKRGIDFIQIPTTLLAMVDASIGGKTGIDLGAYKNQLGVFSNPKAIYCDLSFLQTLDESEIKNGFAEMLKHALILDQKHWKDLKLGTHQNLTEKFVEQSIQLKNEIVLLDPLEQNIRKKLNFGHTFGHALEGYFLSQEEELKHGHAVAMGILCESYLSNKISGLSSQSLEEIVDFILSVYPLIELEEEFFDAIFDLMKQDKKNAQSKILCVLLNEIGESEIDIPLSYEQIIETLNWFKSLKQ
jgi:3-dehydroquinate synthase